MPPIIKITDQKELVPTKNFPLGKFPFENFNQVQSRAFEVYSEDCNLVVAASTSTGKTVIAEMLAAHEIRKNKRKAIYIAPMKALAKEKLDDWADENHHFGDLKISICTGDYQLTATRKKELEEADIIVMTPEMLSSRVRNFKSENNKFLLDVGVLIEDEFHICGAPSRGDHVEISLMKFCKMNPTCRLCLLSATIPNSNEMAEWASYVLNGKNTYLLQSNWRPCPLSVHFETYEHQRNYDDNEEEKVLTALEVLKRYPEDRFLVFVHTKRTGEIILHRIKALGKKVEFHSADLDKTDRHRIENAFRTRELDVLVATSTVAWGCNLPARRVIIVGVHRGLAEVETYDILQEIGRSGRPGYDPRGDAYILVPDEETEYHVNRIQNQPKIQSRLLDYVGNEYKRHYKVLAFHIVSEIHHGEILTKDDLHQWYKKSFAHFQAQDLDDEIVDSTIDLLVKCGAVRLNENDEYEATTIGKIASMFYYSPFDVADLKRNFAALFDSNQQDNDLILSVALANIDSFKIGIVSRADREAMGSFAEKISRIYGTSVSDAATKTAYCYFLALNGLNASVLAPLMRNLQADFPRLNAVLGVIDSMAGKWNKKEFLRKVQLRMTYGVKAEMVPLCEIQNIGKVRAERLWAAGLRTPKDVANNYDRVLKALNMKPERVEEIVNSAKLMEMF